MHLGLTIENSLIAAAIVTNGGDFVWQNSCPIAENDLPLLTSCNALVDTASRDNPGLNETVGISAQSSSIDQLSPHDGLGYLASVDLKRNLQASLGRPAVLASPGQASLSMKVALVTLSKARLLAAFFWMNMYTVV